MIYAKIERVTVGGNCRIRFNLVLIAEDKKLEKFIKKNFSKGFNKYEDIIACYEALAELNFIPVTETFFYLK
jgi:hypothetical protein